MLGDDLDESDDVRVELLQLLSRHPQLDVLTASDLLRLVSGGEVGADAEAGDVADVAGRLVLGVPVARYLRRVLLVEDRVEDGLPLQAGRR